MADHLTLKKIQDVAAALDCYDIRTLEDLRKCISKDIDNSIPWLSTQTKVNHSLLIALLVSEFDDDASLTDKQKLRRYWRSLQTFPSVLKFSRDEVVRLWGKKKSSALLGGPRQAWSIAGQFFVRQHRLWYNWRRYWPDVLVIVILPLLLVFLALRAQSINNRNVRYVTVQQGAAVRAFSKLTDNLTLTNVPYAKGAFTSIDAVRGRYSLVNLPAGATLSSDQVLSSDLSNTMANRSILSVPVKAGGYVSMMRAPYEAVMVLSPRTEEARDSPGASFGVIVLRVDGTGGGGTTSATLAIQKDEFEKATALLASHEVFLAHPPLGP